MTGSAGFPKKPPVASNGKGVAGPVSSPPSPSGAASPRTPPKLVGVSYATWWGADPLVNYCFCNTQTWDSPRDGAYASDSSAAIQRHAAQISYAGIDFALVDWSNDILCQASCQSQRPDLYGLEERTNAVFAGFAALAVKPKLAIMLGTASDDGVDNIANGRLQFKVNQVYDRFVANSTYRQLYQHWKGKPLLIVYVGTPAPAPPPAFSDARFTIRWITGYVDGQAHSPTGESSYWSYKDRTTVTTPSFNRDRSIASLLVPEHAAVTSAYPGGGGWRTPGTATRKGTGNCDSSEGTLGRTLDRQWDRVYNVDPQIVTIASFNEWVVGPQQDQLNPSCSTDIEPSTRLGQTYLDLMKARVSTFRAYRSDIGLFDPNNGSFYFRNAPGYAFETEYRGPRGPGYRAVTGDWNGDGIGDIGLRNTATGVFYLRNGLDFAASERAFGWLAGADFQPFTGDLNGDGIWDLGLRDRRDGTFYFRWGPTFGSETTFAWNAPGDQYQPITGDWNGDGIWDIGLRDANNGFFYFRNGPTYTTGGIYRWGAAGAHYQPFSGDLNSDGLWDIGLRNGSTGRIYFKHGPQFYLDQVDFGWAPGTHYQVFTGNLR